MNKIVSIIHLCSVLLLIVWNAYANTGNYNGNTVGDLSAEYNNLFTPAGYAFSIWGIIFIMLLIFAIFGVCRAFNLLGFSLFAKANQTTSSIYYENLLSNTVPWFLVANLGCTLWVALWLDQYIGLSVLCMLLILVALLLGVYKLGIGVTKANLITRLIVWYPISLYAGWISVAMIANAASWLNTIFDIPIRTQLYITILMVVVAFIVYLLMLVYRRMMVFAAVGVWALVAIFVRYNGHNVAGLHDNQVMQLSAITLTSAVILSIGIVVVAYRTYKYNME